VVVGFATGVAAKENDFLWWSAIANSHSETLRERIADLLNGGLGEYISRLCSELVGYTCNPLCG